MDSVKRSRFTFEVGFICFNKMTNIQQIRNNTEKIAGIFEQIDELKSYIEQLTNGVMAKLGSKETNRIAIQEYNMRIVTGKQIGRAHV